MQEHLGPVMNLARIKLLAFVLHALCVVQTVSLHKIASAIPTCVERIRYYLRIKQNFWLRNPKSFENIRTWHLFHRLKPGQERVCNKLFLLKGGGIADALLQNSDGVPELQILICYNHPETAVTTYKKRWQIETCFKAMKSSGFNIGDTHLRDIDRIARLTAMVCMLWPRRILWGNIKI